MCQSNCFAYRLTLEASTEQDTTRGTTAQPEASSGMQLKKRKAMKKKKANGSITCHKLSLAHHARLLLASNHRKPATDIACSFTRKQFTVLADINGLLYLSTCKAYVLR